jgi:hypothetical protein
VPVRRHQKEREEETNARLLILALVAVLVAVILFWVSQHDAWFASLRPLQARFDMTTDQLGETVREAIREYSAFRRPDGRGVHESGSEDLGAWAGSRCLQP